MAELKTLQAAFANATCAPTQLARLQELYRHHGPQKPVVDALKIAYTSCKAPVELAELLADAAPEGAPAVHRLELAAAWIRATRYTDAIAVLEPLAKTQGPRSQATWLLGMSLFYAGESNRALPLLTEAREHASNSDAYTMIGLAKLHAGDAEGAVTELEQGLARTPKDPSILQGLARAYYIVGRSEDAQRLSQQTQTQQDKLAKDLAVSVRLGTMSTSYRSARASGRLDDALAVVDDMLKIAPEPAKLKILQAKISTLQALGRTAEATAVQQQLTARTKTP